MRDNITDNSYFYRDYLVVQVGGIGHYGPLRSGRAYTLPMSLENVANVVADAVDFAQLSIPSVVFRLRLSGGLDYVRKVYMRPELHGGAHGVLMRQLGI